MLVLTRGKRFRRSRHSQRLASGFWGARSASGGEVIRHMLSWQCQFGHDGQVAEGNAALTRGVRIPHVRHLRYAQESAKEV